MSCAGNPHLHTPHIDALAATGIRFEQSYCASPVCGPSRACLATGRLASENGVLVNGMSIPDSLPTMGEIFREGGYRTAWTGRWCLPGNGPDIRGFECLHDTNVPLGHGLQGDEHVADRAIEFLRQEQDRPFLLGVSLCNPHDICYWIMQQSNPETAPGTDTRRLKKAADAMMFDLKRSDNPPPLPGNFEIDPNEPEFLTTCRRRRYYGDEGTFTWDWDEQTWRKYLNAYYRLTEHVDLQVGRVMAALHAAGMADSTLVVMTSDHGEGMAAHRWVVKLGLYEEPVKVPLILSQPGVIKRSTVDRQHLTSGIDVLPTMCDYAGIECPEVTGISLRKTVERTEKTVREFVLSELYPDTKNLERVGRMVRSSRFKYVAYSEGARAEQLFDLQRDSGEQRNLATKLEYASELKKHRELFCKAYPHITPPSQRST